jgi:membrane protease YdiL (CAAX protease family)
VSALPPDQRDASLPAERPGEPPPEPAGPDPGASAGPVAPVGSPSWPPGPPGGGVFSLEGRPAGGLYFAAWILCLGGIALFVVGALAGVPEAAAVLVFIGFVVLAVGLACAAGYQILARVGRPAARYRGPSPLLLFAIVVCLTFIVVGPLYAAGLVRLTTVGGLVQLVVIAIGYLLTLWLFVVRSGALRWSDLAGPRAAGGRIGRALGDIARAAAIMVPANLALTLAGGIIALALDIRPESPIPMPEGSLDTFALVLAAVVVAPVGEEIFFRGFALTAWQRDLGARAALIRSSVFFAIVHLANVTASTAREGLLLALLAVVVYVPLGFLLGWLFQRRGLLASIAGHATSNATGLLLAAVASAAASAAS